MKRILSVLGAIGVSLLLMSSISWKGLEATGNRSTINLDDYSNINQAFAAAVAAGGGTICIPPGVHTFDKTLVIGDGTDQGGIPIRIVGTGGSVVYKHKPVGAVLLYTARDGTPAIKINNAAFLELSGFALAGGLNPEIGGGIGITGKAVGNGRGIEANLLTSSMFSLLEVSGFDQQGIYLEDSYHNELHSCCCQLNGIGYEGKADNVTTLFNCRLDTNGTGAKNGGRYIGTTFQSNGRNGLLLDVSYGRTSCHDCYFENNGRLDDKEYADIWGGDPKVAVSLSGTTNLQGSDKPRTNRMTHLGGGFMWAQFQGLPAIALYSKNPTGAWEFGSLSNGSAIIDYTPLSNLRTSFAWANKANMVFKP